jgi:hypothetical protein
MNEQQFSHYLQNIGACDEAKEWAEGKSWQEVYDTCHRGDWLLWLYRRSKDYDLQKLTLAKGFCANTVRHLMRDERSLKAVDTAIAFGKGEINIDKLTAAAAAAYAAAADAYDAAYAADAYDAAYAAADAYAAAAYAAAYAAAADAAAAYAAAYAAAADAAAADAARKENQQKTADIVREVLPFDIWEL